MSCPFCLLQPRFHARWRKTRCCTSHHNFVLESPNCSIFPLSPACSFKRAQSTVLAVYRELNYFSEILQKLLTCIKQEEFVCTSFLVIMCTLNCILHAFSVHYIQVELVYTCRVMTRYDECTTSSNVKQWSSRQIIQSDSSKYVTSMLEVLQCQESLSERNGCLKLRNTRNNHAIFSAYWGCIFPTCSLFHTYSHSFNFSHWNSTTDSFYLYGSCISLDKETQ